MIKKYQVFVSSTYEDLIEERKEATQALLETNCIPTGMELFPASNKKQWDIIKRVIDDCDYYLLIIGGRYGSLGRDDNNKKVGYTEMEFDYAFSIGKPIIAFIHKEPGTIPADKCEKTQIGQQRLAKFRKKAEAGRMVQRWTNKDNLKASIVASIPALIKDNPAGGWAKQSNDISDATYTTMTDDLFSGEWQSETEQHTVDRLTISLVNKSPYFKGTITREKPIDQNTRKWNCSGCVVGESMVILYESQSSYSAGCALLRHYRDSIYKGYYLRYNFQSKEIEKKELTLNKLS